MAHEEERPTLIYEARDEKIVSPKDGKSTVRIARFLKPLAKNVNEAVVFPNTPLLSEIFSHNLQQWPSKVLFRGWKLPQKKWKEWVDRLAEKYGIIWNQAGICDAIMSSIYEVRCNQELVLGLSEFWCPETNTFVFPWGEATITLEDVMILGGFPVLGQPVTSSPLTAEFIEIEEEMNKQRLEMSRSKARKAGHPGWLKHFMEEEGEFEHVAFLSLWLSRYVFPSFAEETIGKHVFPIAARLSQGIQVALAPAVLASLYKDLRFLREQAISSSGSIVVSAPFQLVQLWAFERFPLTGPNSPNSLEPGEPRVALWHKLNSKINVPLVRSALRLQENFQWRPYAINLKNWRHTSYYKESEQLVFDNSCLDDELRSFLRCLQASELVGIGCKEKYLPQRVAMQFGMDQDLAGDNSGFNLISENTKFFVPPRSFEPGVSRRYFSWWKKSTSARRDAVKDVLVQKGIVKKSKTSRSVQVKINEEDCQASVESRSPKKPCTISQASTKSVGKGSPASLENSVIRSNGASRAAMKPTLSASAHAKNCEDDSHVADSSRTLKSPQKLSQVSSKSNTEERYASVTPEFSSKMTNQDSSNDDIVTAKCVSPTCGIVNENCGKLLSKPEENPQGKATIRSTNGVAEEMERKVDSGNGPNEVNRELKRRALDAFVQELIAKKSKTSPSVQAKINEEDCQASVESRSLKKPCTISQASTKSVGKGSPASLENSVIRANGASRAAMKPTLSASAHAKNCEDDSHAADSSRALKSPQKLSQVSSKSSTEERHASVTPEFSSKMTNQDSSNGDIVTAKCVSPTCGIVNENCGKLLSKPEENPQGKATIRSTNGVAKEMEREVDSGNGPNEVYRELKRRVLDAFVQELIAKKSKTSPSVQAKINEEDCQASVESRSLKKPCTISQASTKSVGKGSPASLENSVIRANGASRAAMKPTLSASAHAKNCEDDSHAADSSRTLKSPQKLSQVSSKSNTEERHASVTHEVRSKITYQDSSNDDIVTAKCVSPTCGIVNENCGKLLSKPEENPQGKATIRSTNRVAKERARKVDSGNGPDEVSREAKRMASDSANDPLDSVSLSEWIKLRKGGTEPVKDVEEEKNEAGGSFNNPIDVDCCIETSKRRSQKLGQDLEGRVQKLEELLGVTL